MQALAGAAWWALVPLVPAVREATLGGIDPVWMAAADLPLFVLASALAAAGLRWATWVVVPWTLLVALGMIAYATVTGQAGWGALLMIASSILGIAAGALVLTGRIPVERMLVGPFAFRPARRVTSASLLASTAGQIALFWGLFLVVIPLLLLVLERRWGVHVEAPLAVRIAGAVLFVVASGLGLWSAWSMSTRGRGTPLPAAMATRLVVSGPYRIVRNPMAVAGIAQGVAVGLLLGSWIVVAYALCGSIFWNIAVRPIEERDLAERFGDDFEAYRRRVGCWVPWAGRRSSEESASV